MGISPQSSPSSERRADQRSGEHMATAPASHFRSNLKLSRKLKDHSLDSAMNGIAIADLDGFLIYINDAFQKMWGYDSCIEILGRQVIEFWRHQKKVTGVVSRLDSEGSWEGELTGLRKDGSTFYCAVKTQIVFDKLRKPIGKIAFFQDISALHRALRDFRRQEIWFKTLIERSTDYLFVIGLDMSIRYASPSYLRYYGALPVAESNRSLIESIHPRDRKAFVKRFHQFVRGEKSWRSPIEFRIRANSGRWVPWEAWATNLAAHPVIRGVLINARDISVKYSSRRKAQKAFDQLRGLSGHLLRVREEERKILAREIHDEIGGFLTVLKMEIDAPLRDADTLSADLCSRFNRLNTLGDTGYQVIQRLICRLRPVWLEELGLNKALEQEVKEFRKRTSLRICMTRQGSIEKRKGALSKERELAVFRIFQECLNNIARHARASSVRVEISEDDRSLNICVRDNGCGIRKADISSRNSFGLIGMRERLLPFGGKIAIRAVPSGGTEVSIRMPKRGTEDLK
jgi:PAS domain S-box-containing protein